MDAKLKYETAKDVNKHWAENDLVGWSPICVKIWQACMPNVSLAKVCTKWKLLGHKISINHSEYVEQNGRLVLPPMGDLSHTRANSRATRKWHSKTVKRVAHRLRRHAVMRTHEVHESTVADSADSATASDLCKGHHDTTKKIISRAHGGRVRTSSLGQSCCSKSCRCSRDWRLGP